MLINQAIINYKVSWCRYVCLLEIVQSWSCREKTFFWFHQPAYLTYVSEGDLQKEMSPVNVSQSKYLLFIPRIINSSNVHTTRKTKITSQPNNPSWNLTCYSINRMHNKWWMNEWIIHWRIMPVVSHMFCQ
jgi:hypothetical protein